jgi:hypothetical protein
MKASAVFCEVKAVLIALTVFLVSCGESPSYRSFMGRSQTYYVEIADACDQLAAKSSVDVQHGQKMKGDEPSLPQILRDLRPKHLVVGTNGVGIRIGAGRGSYTISWAPNNYTPTRWELVTDAEGTTRILFASIRVTVPQGSSNEQFHFRTPSNITPQTNVKGTNDSR